MRELLGAEGTTDNDNDFLLVLTLFPILRFERQGCQWSSKIVIPFPSRIEWLIDERINEQKLKVEKEMDLGVHLINFLAISSTAAVFLPILLYTRPTKRDRLDYRTDFTSLFHCTRATPCCTRKKDQMPGLTSWREQRATSGVYKKNLKVAHVLSPTGRCNTSQHSSHYSILEKEKNQAKRFLWIQYNARKRIVTFFHPIQQMISKIY